MLLSLTHVRSCSYALNPPHSRKVLESLTCVTEDEVSHLIRVASCKSSDLDPVLTSLEKDCIDILLTPITSVVNLSLSEGSFPSHFKSALVSPLLQESTLDKDNLKNYRPMSNLSFLPKVLEKVVAIRLNSHINSSNVSNHYQSAYKKLHSTKTALLQIHIDIDILFSMDYGRVTALALLDLSAAFDIIDHTIPFRRLDDWFGVSGKALDWFRSCLTGRCQRIKLGDCLSSEADLSFGVPQGSVLGPSLFTLYTTRLSSMISGLDIPHHLYADDSQL